MLWLTMEVSHTGQLDIGYIALDVLLLYVIRVVNGHFPRYG